MEKDLVSIIVPVYNVEKYLEECIKSVINQTYKNIELILVDDGSTDTSPEVCDKWEKKDNRIKVLHKKNEGLGLTRNTGINLANGKYIYFLDSDDYIDINTIEICYELAQKNNADIVNFGFKSVNNDKVIFESIPNMPKNVYKNNEIIDILLPDFIANNPASKTNTNLTLSACMMFTKKELIDKCNFKFESERNVISEDICSLPYLYKNANTIAIIQKALYNYRVNYSSITHSFSKNKIKDIEKFYNYFSNQCDELKLGEETKERAGVLAITDIMAHINNLIKEKDYTHSTKIKEIKKIFDNDWVIKLSKKTFKKSKIFKYKLIYFLFYKKMSIATYILFYFKERRKK